MHKSIILGFTTNNDGKEKVAFEVPFPNDRMRVAFPAVMLAPAVNVKLWLSRMTRFRPGTPPSHTAFRMLVLSFVAPETVIVYPPS